VIVIVDYGMGNVGSILNMLRKFGEPCALTARAADLLEADGVILPGVGAFDAGVESLQRHGLFDVLRGDVMRREVPVLGICLGMQLLTCGSEEGRLPGLGVIDAHTRRFEFPSGETALPVPHMGWAEVVPAAGAQAQDTLAAQLFQSTEPEQRYYFVHSYHVCCSRASDVLATARYGIEFSAAIGCGNVAGTQFHPEKSLRYGLGVMQNYIQFCRTRAGLAAR
jgi:glutamine amidotransferase